MKRQIKLISFLMLISAKIFAVPLSGTYTIGGASPDYPTFSAAVSDLTANGVNGKVTFKVRTGTYTEQITLGAVTGASVANTITFEAETGNAADVTLKYGASGTGNNWVVKLTGASRIVFNQMTLQSTGAGYSNVVAITNISNYNNITNCIVTAPVTSTTSLDQVLITMGDNTLCEHNGVSNCTLTNGSYGMYSSHAGFKEGLSAVNNTFLNQYAGGLHDVANRYYSIRNNTVTTNADNSSYIGFYLENFYADTVKNNKLTDIPGTGIVYNNCQAFVLSNNFIQITGTAVNNGFLFSHLNGPGGTDQISFNTILVLNTNPASAAFRVDEGYSQQIGHFKNNILVNRGGGYVIYVLDYFSLSRNYNGSYPEVDYNNYYTTGPVFGHWGGYYFYNYYPGTECATFADWLTATHTAFPESSATAGFNTYIDTHSQNINPTFVSNTDLHLANDHLRFGAPATADLQYDIDGELRNTTTPNVGADESTGPQLVHADFAGSITTICTGSTVTYTDQSSGSPTGWTWTFSGGSPGSSASQSPVVTYNTAGTYDVKLLVSNSAGKDSVTKSGYITVGSLPDGGSVTGDPATVCSGSSAQLSVTGSAGTLQWQSSADGISFNDIPGASSSSYNAANLTATTYYRVTASSSCGTDNSTFQQITVIPQPVAGTITAVRDTICAGTPGSLSVTGSSGDIQWQDSIPSGSFTNIPGATNSSYTSSLSQTTFYRVKVANGSCSALSGVQQMVVKPSPVTNFTFTVTGMKVDFNSSSGPPFIYDWDFGDTSGSTVANPDHVYGRPDTFHVCLTVFNGSNCSFTICHDVNVGVTGVITLRQLTDNFLIYPNPFDNTVSIDIGQMNNPVKRIEINDLVGRVIFSRDYETENDLIQLNLPGLPKAVYYLKVITERAIFSYKIIKQ